MMQGHGTMQVGNKAVCKIESPSMIYHGKLTHDEYFVTHEAAKKGVTITNNSGGNLVMLKHFGPENKQLNIIKVSDYNLKHNLRYAA